MGVSNILLTATKSYDLSEKGHLLNPSDWDTDFAKELAKAEGTELTDEQISVISFISWYHQEYSIFPATTTIRRHVRKKFGQHRTLYSIFPNALGGELARYAGVPVPTGCI